MKFPPGYVPGVGVSKPQLGGFGERMLASMGWQKGQGLGRNKDGIKEAIQVKKKDDTVGIGGAAGWNWAERYWESAFDSAAKSIKHDGDTSSSSDSSASSSSDSSDSRSDSSGYSSDDSDSDADAATAANRAGSSSADSSGAGSSGADSSGYSSDDSDSDAGGGASHKRHKKAAKGRTKRRAAGAAAGVRVHRDGTVATADADELRIAAELAKDPWGRWGGREGKLARIREQEAALLAKWAAAGGSGGGGAAAAAVPESAGGVPVAVAAAAAAAAAGAASDGAAAAAGASDGGKRRKRKGAGGGASDGAGAASDSKRAKRSKQRDAKDASGADAARKDAGGAASAGPSGGSLGETTASPGRAKGMVFIVRLPGCDAIPAPTCCTCPEGWWGFKHFVWGGVLGAGSEAGADKAQPRERQQFDENDQEALYMAAHGGKASGKTGLGRRGGSGKIGGAKWEGKKVVFGDDDDADGGEDREGNAASTAAAADEQQQPAKQQQQQQPAKQQQQQQRAGGQDGGKGGGGKGKKAAAASAAAAAGGAGSGKAGAGAGVVSRLQGVKWKRLMAAELDKSAGRQLRVKALVRGVLAQLAAKGHLPSPKLGKADKAELTALLLAKAGGSSQFEVDGNRVARALAAK